MTQPSTSLVCTVRNEAATIDGLLDSIAAQTHLPDEIVIVDGGSDDATVTRLQGWTGRLPLRILQCPGAGISAGRNAAIAAASHDVLLVTDAGVRLDPGWAESLAAPFADPAVHHVAGFFRADPGTLFELALGATVLPVESEIDPGTFLPSSRSFAVRRSAVMAIGGYPEWLDYCEDLVLDFALRERYGPPAWPPRAIAWFRPRGSLAAFFRQYFRYARGDGKAGLWPRRHLIRYATYGALVLLLTGAFWFPPLPLLALPGVILYCRHPWARLGAYRLHGRDWVTAWLLVPPIRASGDVAKMLGYPAGLWWRLRHRPKTTAQPLSV